VKASNGLIDLSSGETVGHDEANRMDWMLASSIASASDLSLYNKGHAVDTMKDWTTGKVERICGVLSSRRPAPVSVALAGLQRWRRYLHQRRYRTDIPAGSKESVASNAKASEFC